MPPAARKGDPHTCPKVEPGPTPHVGGPILTGSPDVEIEGMPAARADGKAPDTALCVAGGPDKLHEGCGTVLVNFKLAARVGDRTFHGGKIAVGAGTVEIGVAGDGVAVGPIGGAGTSGGESPSGHASGKKSSGIGGNKSAAPDDDKGQSNAARPKLSVQPQELDFGYVNRRTECKPQELIIENVGDAGSVLEVSLDLKPPFSVDSPQTFTLTVGESRALPVCFKPVTHDEFVDTLTVTSNDPSETSRAATVLLKAATNTIIRLWTQAFIPMHVAGMTYGLAAPYAELTGFSIPLRSIDEAVLSYFNIPQWIIDAVLRLDQFVEEYSPIGGLTDQRSYSSDPHEGRFRLSADLTVSVDGKKLASVINSTPVHASHSSIFLYFNPIVRGLLLGFGSRVDNYYFMNRHGTSEGAFNVTSQDESGLEVSFHGRGTPPPISWWPIRFDRDAVDLFIDWNALIHFDLQSASVEISAKTDEFPAYEMYASVDESQTTTIFATGPVPGTTTGSLTGGATIVVNCNKVIY